MNLIEQVVHGYIEEGPPDTRPPVSLGLRINPDHGELLAAVAERLHTTRHRLAIELLEAAIEEAGHLVGVELVPGPEGVEVALFDDPREDKKA